MNLLIENFDVIKEESLQLYSSKKLIDITRTKYISENLLDYVDNWVRGWTNNDNWINYGIFYANTWNDTLKTTNILKDIEKKIDKKIIMAGFSVLKAGGSIVIHKDEDMIHTEKNVFHLGLVVPDKCSLYVSEIKNGEKTIIKYNEEDGCIISFDDGNEHFAVNESNKDRIILYIKFDIPHI